MVNTWNTYIQISGEGRLLIPVGYIKGKASFLTSGPDFEL